MYSAAPNGAPACSSRNTVKSVFGGRPETPPRSKMSKPTGWWSGPPRCSPGRAGMQPASVAEDGVSSGAPRPRWLLETTRQPRIRGPRRHHRRRWCRGQGRSEGRPGPSECRGHELPPVPGISARRLAWGHAIRAEHDAAQRSCACSAGGWAGEPHPGRRRAGERWDRRGRRRPAGAAARSCSSGALLTSVPESATGAGTVAPADDRGLQIRRVPRGCRALAGKRTRLLIRIARRWVNACTRRRAWFSRSTGGVTSSREWANPGYVGSLVRNGRPPARREG